MPILTYIDGIPLYTTKAEAISWGASKNPKVLGYHTHTTNSGVTGYMAGYIHSTNIANDYTSDFYQGIINEADDITKLSSFYNNITIDHQESQSLLNDKSNSILEQISTIDYFPVGDITEIQQQAINDLISQLQELIDSIKQQADKNKNQLSYIQSLNISEFNLYIKGLEVPGKPYSLPIVFDPKKEAQLVLEAVDKILGSITPSELVRVQTVVRELSSNNQVEDVRTPQSSRY